MYRVCSNLYFLVLVKLCGFSRIRVGSFLLWYSVLVSSEVLVSLVLLNYLNW